MKVSLELAANYFETIETYLYSNPKYSKYVSKAMFDMDRYIADQEQTQESPKKATAAKPKVLKPCKKLVGFIDGMREITVYEEQIQEIENYEDIDFEENETHKSHIPFLDREPLTAHYIMRVYWVEQKTTLQIANKLNVPEGWVQKQIKKLRLGKRERGIRFKSGHKNKVMSKEQRKKHQNQPHAKPIVQICPKTYLTIREYSSQGAVERYGFSRENVRRAIKTCGLSKGYLWAFKDLREATVRVAKKKESLIKRKLQAREYKKPTKKQLEQLYIVQKKTLKECANIFNCHPTTLAILAGKYGLKKRTGKVSKTQLKYLYINKGLQAKQIAKKLNYSTSSISTYLSRFGIKREAA